MKINLVGIDLAKSSFQIHAVDADGGLVTRKRLTRKALMVFISKLEPCMIAMEACGGAHHLARSFIHYGHDVRLIPAQYVKPFVKTNKNDSNDAEAICEAAVRPSMHFVQVKALEQQDIQCLHRHRSRLMAARVALINEARGFLLEYGVVIPQGAKKFVSNTRLAIEDGASELTERTRALILEMLEELKQIEERIQLDDAKIQEIFRASEICQRIGEIEGIGPLTATAVMASVGKASAFQSARQMAAWIGLVPRQHSTGGRDRLFGISKRGDSYLRTLLIHGGRACVRTSSSKSDARSQWITRLAKERGVNRAAVAVANKNARIIWKMMMSGAAYRKAA